MPQVYRILILCTGNSARSIMAEAIFNDIGKGRLQAYSAGSFPTGKVNTHAIALLKSRGFPTEGLRSKSWDEFAREGAPDLDYVITVCDNAAGEICPLWPGKPVLAHWGLPDPAAATGGDAEIAAAFLNAYRTLEARVERFAALPIAQLEPLTLKRRVAEIGEVEADPT
jgi:arsenate reductase